MDAGAICPYMKEIDLADVRDSLAEMRYRIDVPAPTAARARGVLERMIAT